MALATTGHCYLRWTNIELRYNIAQTTMIEVVVPHQAGMLSDHAVPSTPNARVETIVSKPIFPAAFMHGRCLIRASGYYE